MKTENKKSIKRLTLDIPEELHRKLKVRAVNEGKSMKELAEAWITEKLKGT